MYSVWHFFFQIEALLHVSLKNAWLPPKFFLDTKSACYTVSPAFSA